MMCQEELHDSVYSFTQSLDLLQRTNIKQNQQRKRLLGQSPQETKCKLPRHLSQWSQAGRASFLQQQVITTCVKYCLPLETHWRLHTQRFYWKLGTWAPLPGMQQNPRTQGEKQVFSRNYIIYTGSLCTVSQSHHLEAILHQYRELFTIQVPRCQPRQAQVCYINFLLLLLSLT